MSAYGRVNERVLIMFYWVANNSKFPSDKWRFDKTDTHCSDALSRAMYFCRFILGLQPRDKAAMLVVNTKETFLPNLHQNRVHFPAERNAFVLDHLHGRRDVTCKPAIAN